MMSPVSMFCASSPTASNYINTGINALATVIAALVAAAVLYVGQRILERSNDRQVENDRRTARTQATLATNTKLADMRQTWLNNLRADISQFHSIFCLIPRTQNMKM